MVVVGRGAVNTDSVDPEEDGLFREREEKRKNPLAETRSPEGKGEGGFVAEGVDSDGGARLHSREAESREPRVYTSQKGTLLFPFLPTEIFQKKETYKVVVVVVMERNSTVHVLLVNI